MTNVLLVIACFGMLLALTKPLGIFMHRIFSCGRSVLSPLPQPVEHVVYRLTGVDEEREMHGEPIR